MLALRWHGRRDVRLDEVPPPRAPGPGEVQLAVFCCGICGTDVEEWRSGPRVIPIVPHPLTGCVAPLTLGHEFSGEVVAVGDNVEGLVPGDFAAVDGLLYCGKCYWCRRNRVNRCERLGCVGLTMDGGLAPLCNVPAATCLAIPRAMDREIVSLAEPLAVAARAVRRGKLRLGERVTVVGAGAIGLMALQVARTQGASVGVVEPHEFRRSLALELGADWCVPPQDATTYGSADLVIECSGNARAAKLAVGLSRAGGRVVLAGVYPDDANFVLNPIVHGERHLIGSLSHIYDEDFRLALSLLERGLVRAEPLISDRIRLAQSLDDGLLALVNHADRHLKILVYPNGMDA
jgi:(R,R)-butanediol dehydrogenase/meso-butanediol dehydrogenase/diacetyl reductase